VPDVFRFGGAVTMSDAESATPGQVGARETKPNRLGTAVEMLGLVFVVSFVMLGGCFLVLGFLGTLTTLGRPGGGMWFLKTSLRSVMATTCGVAAVGIALIVVRKGRLRVSAWLSVAGILFAWVSTKQVVESLLNGRVREWPEVLNVYTGALLPCVALGYIAHKVSPKWWEMQLGLSDACQPMSDSGAVNQESSTASSPDNLSH
jgi:hypothetical protein